MTSRAYPPSEDLWLKSSVFTILGNITGLFIMSALSVAGLSAIIIGSELLFSIVKFVGAIYLVYLGLKLLLRSPGSALQAQPAVRSRRSLFLQGFMTSAANPKAVVFFAALFPQFISNDQPFLSQFLILCLTYLVLDAMYLSLYGLGASWISARFKGKARAWIERTGGGFMIGAAILLGFKSVELRTG